MKNILKKENLGKSKRNLLLIMLAVMILFITAVGYVLTFENVTIIDGKKELHIKTREKTVEEVLEEEEITYDKEDSIKPALDSKIKDQMKIIIQRAVPITIEADGKVHKLKTTAQNVKAAIKEAGIQLGEKDAIAPTLDTELEKNMKIHIQRAIPCTIQVDGEIKKLLTTAPTVKDVLKEEKITLGKKDKISPGLEKEIQKDMEIKVTRITEETIHQEEKIPFDTVKRNTSSLNKGMTKVVQGGQNGIKENTIHIVYENGKEVSREVVESKVTRKPIGQIVNVGTREVQRTTFVASRGATTRSATTSSQGRNRSYRTMTVVATGYSSQDPGVDNITSTGATLKKGIIAVDPSVIPYGTRIYVPGYGYGIAADTGGGIRGNRLDLAFSNKSQALNFGRRTVTIRIYR